MAIKLRVVKLRDDSPWADGAQVFTSTSDSSKVLHVVRLSLANDLTPEGEADGSLQRQPQWETKKKKNELETSGRKTHNSEVANSRLLIFIFQQRIRNGTNAHKSLEYGQGSLVKGQTVDSCQPPRGRTWHKALLSAMRIPKHSG